jgi:hypothetical protein
MSIVPQWFKDMGFQYGVFPSLFKQAKTSGKYPTVFNSVDETSFDMLNFQEPNGQIQLPSGKWALGSDGTNDTLQRSNITPTFGTTYVFCYEKIPPIVTAKDLYGVGTNISNNFVIYLNTVSKNVGFGSRNNSGVYVNSSSEFNSVIDDNTTRNIIAITISTTSVTFRVNATKRIVIISYSQFITATEQLHGWLGLNRPVAAHLSYFLKLNKEITDEEYAYFVNKPSDLGLMPNIYGANQEYMDLLDPVPLPKILQNKAFSYGVFPSLLKRAQTTGLYPAASICGCVKYNMSGFDAPFGQVQGADGKWSLSTDGVDDRIYRATGAPAINYTSVCTLVFGLRQFDALTDRALYMATETGVIFYQIQWDGVTRTFRLRFFNGTQQVITSTIAASSADEYNLLAVSFNNKQITMRINELKETPVAELARESAGGGEEGVFTNSSTTLNSSVVVRSCTFAYFNKALSDAEWAEFLAAPDDLGITSELTGTDGGLMVLRDTLTILSASYSSNLITINGEYFTYKNTTPVLTENGVVVTPLTITDTQITYRTSKDGELTYIITNEQNEESDGVTITLPKTTISSITNFLNAVVIKGSNFITESTNPIVKENGVVITPLTIRDNEITYETQNIGQLTYTVTNSLVSSVSETIYMSFPANMYAVDDQRTSMELISQSVRTRSVSFTNGKYSILYGNNKIVFKGAELEINNEDGILVVHPINNLPGHYHNIQLTSGYMRGDVLFDEVIQQGTTVNVSKVTLFEAFESE